MDHSRPDILRGVGDRCGAAALTLAQMFSRPAAVLIEAVMAPRLPPRPCHRCSTLIPGGTRPWPRCTCEAVPDPSLAESQPQLQPSASEVTIAEATAPFAGEPTQHPAPTPVIGRGQTESAGMCQHPTVIRTRTRARPGR